MHLTGRRALVTGGTRGIGRAITCELATAGAQVVSCYRSDHEAAAVLRDSLGDRHRVVAADVTDADSVAALVAGAVESMGGLDVLVHCAGVISHVPLDELPLAEWRRVVDTNLTAAFLLAHHALPVMTAGASVVLIGSGSAMVGIPHRAHYTAAKAGLLGFSRSLAKEVGGRGIRVNVVASGVVQTEQAVSEDVVQAYRRRIPLGRLGSPEEIAAAVSFLAGNRSSYITGSTLSVDGGL